MERQKGTTTSGSVRIAVKSFDLNAWCVFVAWAECKHHRYEFTNRVSCANHNIFSQSANIYSYKLNTICIFHAARKKNNQKNTFSFSCSSWNYNNNENERLPSAFYRRGVLDFISPCLLHFRIQLHRYRNCTTCIFRDLLSVEMPISCTNHITALIISIHYHYAY